MFSIKNVGDKSRDSDKTIQIRIFRRCGKRIVVRGLTRCPPMPANSRPQWIAPRKESRTAP
jgi:hypothetical protein